jgi:transcriptional regulator with XRE-family HTH domain
MNHNKIVGQKIKQRRLDLKLTCQELGNKVNYSKTRISDIENGKSSIDIEKLIAFSKALDTTLIYFISDLN